MNYVGLLACDPTPQCIGRTQDKRNVMIDWVEVFPAKRQMSLEVWKYIASMYVHSASTLLGDHIPKGTRVHGSEGQRPTRRSGTESPRYVAG